MLVVWALIGIGRDLVIYGRKEDKSEDSEKDRLTAGGQSYVQLLALF